jgi:hypothetical protein
MQWRRGLLLAAIHLAVAGTLIVLQEKTVWPHLFADDAPLPQPSVQPTDSPHEQTVSFSPCGMWEHIPNDKTVLMTGGDASGGDVQLERWLLRYLYRGEQAGRYLDLEYSLYRA